MAFVPHYGSAGLYDQDPNRQQQPPQQTGPRAPIAPGPAGYQQYGDAPQSNYGAPQQPQFAQAPQQYSQPVAQDNMGGLTAQMGAVDMTGSTRSHRKKGRHAYHDLGQPASAHVQPAETAPQFVSNAQGTPSQPATMFVNPADKLRMGEEAVTTQGRVDPEQVPSVARARDAATQQYQTQIYPTMEKHLPPPGAVPVVAHDQGNSSPKHARLTVNSIPHTAEALASTGLPLGLVMQPFAAPQEGEQSVPCLDFGEAGPPRCRRCRTYINPFMTFRAGGSKMVCNMCSFPNDVAPEYFAPTDPSGVRVDRAQRPELMLGTCEYLVPKEYWAKEPFPLRWLFLIDITTEAIDRGYLHTVCQGIMRAIYGSESEGEELDDRPPLPAGSRVGIVTYDREVQFYNLSPELSTPQMMVMTDLEEPFVPLSTGLFVDPTKSKELITSLLAQIPTMFTQKNPESALLPTLSAALEALKPTGGKIICTLASLPTFGPGKLTLRDDGKSRDTDAEKKLFTTDNAVWKKTAQSMVTAGVGVDFFVSSPGGTYMDIATIGHMSRLTGGEMFFYPNFIYPRDSTKVHHEIEHAFRRETGYQALMKVRCSNGLQVASYHGSFLQHNFGADLEIGTIDADKAIGVVFSYDGKLDSKLDAHFQAALLYTSADGQRRVRCINVVAGVNEGAAETMRTVDQDAVVNIIAKEASSKITEKSLKDIRSGITEKTIDVLAAYRKNFSGSHPPGQLVLPENLKEFSVYMLGLIKSRAFKGIVLTSSNSEAILTCCRWHRTKRPTSPFSTTSALLRRFRISTLPLSTDICAPQPYRRGLLRKPRNNATCSASHSPRLLRPRRRRWRLPCRQRPNRPDLAARPSFPQSRSRSLRRRQTIPTRP